MKNENCSFWNANEHNFLSLDKQKKKKKTQFYKQIIDILHKKTIID